LIGSFGMIGTFGDPVVVDMVIKFISEGIFTIAKLFYTILYHTDYNQKVP
jgi:hypothetical protein